MFYVGIDIAKRSHVAAVIDEAENVVVGPFEFANTQSGFKKLLGKLEGARAGCEGAFVGMEATGHYWIALFDFLNGHGCQVAVINPIQTDAYRKVDTVRKTKTDKVDALLIADLIRVKAFDASEFGNEATDGLRSLARFRTSLVEEVASLKNTATALLDRVFPEYERLFSDTFSPSSKALLKHYATPEKVLACDIRTLAKTLKEASRGRLGRDKAEEVKAAARRSVGVAFAADALAFQIAIIVDNIDFVSGQIKELESEMERMLEQTSGKWLVSIPGIGVTLASLIAGEIGDANRFADPHKLIAYAGMDASKNQSGESDGRGHMSKRGSSYLRWALMQGADCVRKHDPYFGDYYAKKTAQGAHHYVALSGVARKLSGVVLALMKEQRPYVPTPPKNHQPGHLES